MDSPVTSKVRTDKHRRRFLKKTIIRVKKVAPEADDLKLTNDHSVQPWKVSEKHKSFKFLFLLKRRKGLNDLPNKQKLM